jgi:hypothetical protein
MSVGASRHHEHVERRTWIKWLSGTVRIVVETEGRPVERYAVRLELLTPTGWQTIYLFDNAHGQHDEHRYAGTNKLAAGQFMVGTVEEVLPAAIELLSTDHGRIIEDWRTRSDD